MKNTGDHENFLDFIQSSSVLTHIATEPGAKNFDSMSTADHQKQVNIQYE
jgi:hypothetical protein